MHSCIGKFAYNLLIILTWLDLRNGSTRSIWHWPQLACQLAFCGRFTTKTSIKIYSWTHHGKSDRFINHFFEYKQIMPGKIHLVVKLTDIFRKWVIKTGKFKIYKNVIWNGLRMADYFIILGYIPRQGGSMYVFGPPPTLTEDF